MPGKVKETCVGNNKINSFILTKKNRMRLKHNWE